jgi:hypothetical protein
MKRLGNLIGTYCMNTYYTTDGGPIHRAPATDLGPDREKAPECPSLRSWSRCDRFQFVLTSSFRLISCACFFLPVLWGGNLFAQSFTWALPLPPFD